MKILISAIGCNPYQGSEDYFGWAAVRCLAQDHELWVLTTPRNRLDIEHAAREGLVPENVHFSYAGRFKEWPSNRMRAKLQAWNEYYAFNRSILPCAQALHASINFDVAHHVTFATWRVPSPLWKLGIPFVFGPVAGNEQIPPRFFRELSPSAAAYELLRRISGRISSLSPSVLQCIRSAKHVLVATSEMEQLAIRLRKSVDGISRLSPAFYPIDRCDSFTVGLLSKESRGVLRLFAGGFLEGRKCVASALRALAKAKLRGVKFRYRVGGHGPESAHLKKLVGELDLQNEVVLGEPLSGEAYRKELSETHAYLLPSLRESAGLTMMEAMLSGCVPIVADCGGPALIVTDDCGYRIPVSNPKRFVEDLTETIVTIDKNREIIQTKGRAASRRIAGMFTEDCYRATVNNLYQSMAGKRALSTASGIKSSSS